MITYDQLSVYSNQRTGQLHCPHHAGYRIEEGMLESEY